MSDGRDFGTIINERRLELGYSLGQLANRIGVTAAQVRAWERGAETPDDATVGRIAGELDLPGADLRSSLRAGAPAKPVPAVPDRPEDATAAVMAVFSDAGDTVSAAAEPTGGVADPGPGDAVPDGPSATGGEHDGKPDPGEGSDLLDLPTEAVPVVVPSTPPSDAVPAVPVPSAPAGVALAAPPVAAAATATGAKPGTTPAATQQPGLLAGWNRALRTLFDPERRFLFWLRTGLTVVVLLVFLRVLAWAVPAFFDTLGDILDTIETTTETTIVDGVPGTTPSTSLPSTTLPRG